MTGNLTGASSEDWLPTDAEDPAAGRAAEPAAVPGDPGPAGEPAAAPGSTGHPVVDAALAAVARAAGAAPADQLPAYQAAHRTLRETLAGIGDG